ncbi:hypothetical protein OG863_02285 [Streptomyces decoyicus]|uniref:Secreted protein n=1 Tax=Streptomyces decoyicus TaxID=249567 RepID=A0ABZ1F979_9ACTN|nr:hypothetical protein [Streptomyces decoyicus]WSB66884.1 hypothetical protein OG863_02285 [Streptomyces decoyicus]
MTGSAERPLLFLDVDGPLLPFGAANHQSAGGYPTYPTGHDPSETGAHPLLARIDPALGPRLAALPCHLVWATTWMAEANECIAPRLGLPELPMVTWPDPSFDEERDTRAGLHWKTRTLLDWAALPTGELTGTRSTWGDASRSCQGWLLPSRVSDRR